MGRRFNRVRIIDDAPEGNMVKGPGHLGLHFVGEASRLKNATMIANVSQSICCDQAVGFRGKIVSPLDLYTFGAIDDTPPRDNFGIFESRHVVSLFDLDTFGAIDDTPPMDNFGIFESRHVVSPEETIKNVWPTNMLEHTQTPGFQFPGQAQVPSSGALKDMQKQPSVQAQRSYSSRAIESILMTGPHTLDAEVTKMVTTDTYDTMFETSERSVETLIRDARGEGHIFDWPPISRAARRESISQSPNDVYLSGISSPEVHGTLNKVAVRALPDWGSTVNAVSEAFARRHSLDIDTNYIESIPLLGGHVVESIGRVVGQFSFNGEKDTYRLVFKVLRKSLHDVILGRNFLDATKTLTKYSHRIVHGVRSCIRRGKRLFLMDEAPKERIRCAVNGSTAAAFPDTGSDLMLVSGDFVRRNGFHVRRGEKYRTQLQLINGTTIQTDGMVLDAKLQFDIPPSSHELNYDRYHGYLSGLSSLTKSADERRKTSYICDLHVVENLPCDLILSNDFIFQNDVFSKFQSLFYAEAVIPWEEGAVAMDRCLLFVRNKSVKLSWFLRRNRRTDIEASSVPRQDGPAWDDLWEAEIAQRNRIQLRIASLPEPQKSAEQRIEAHRQSIWDRENPRPRQANPAPSSGTSARRTRGVRSLPATAQRQDV